MKIVYKIKEDLKALLSKKRLVRIAAESALLFILLWILLIVVSRSACKIAIEKLANSTNTLISTESLGVNIDGSVTLNHLLIQNNGKDKSEILKAQKARINFSRISLLLLKPRVTRIILDNSEFNLQYDIENKKLLLPKLKLSGKGTGRVPLIRLNNMLLKYNKISESSKKDVTQVAIDLKISSRPLTLRQKQRMADLGDEKIICFFDLNAGSWLDFGESKISGMVRQDGVEATGALMQEQQGKADKLTADNIYTILKLEENKDYLLNLNIKNLASREKSVEGSFAKLTSLFPEPVKSFDVLQEVFERFRPGGQIDLNVAFSGNLTQLDKSKILGTVLCKDVWVLDRQFEYKVENMKGTIDVSEKGAVLNDLKGMHGDVGLTISGYTKKQGDDEDFRFQIASDNMLFDDDLYKALKPEEQKFWDDFAPEGRAGINQVIEKHGSGDKQGTLKINLASTDARWAKFPYPLKALEGQVFIDSNQITFTDVFSQMGDEQITINGSVSSYDAEIPVYDINIVAKNAEPNFIQEPVYQEALCDLIPEYYFILMNQFDVDGKADFQGRFRNYTNTEDIDFTIFLDFLGSGIEHTKFTYPIKNVRGRLKIQNDSIELQQITASVADNIQITPESSRLKLDGKIKLSENGFAGSEIQLSVKDVPLDERLRLILPKEWSQSYNSISPTGRFDIDFKDLQIITSADGEKYYDLKTTLKFKECTFDLSIPVTEFSGVMNVEGLYKSSYGFSEGQAEIEDLKMRVKNKLLSDMNATFIYDDNLKSWESYDVDGYCYDGGVFGRFAIINPQDETTGYVLDIAFENIDLKQFLMDEEELQQKEQEITSDTPAEVYSEGNMSGILTVQGKVNDTSGRLGRCRLGIKNMQVGKLSPIAKLLYILNLTEPRDFAFDQMAVESYIKGNELMLEKVDLAGKAAAFNGSGELDLLNFVIDMNLTARGKRLSLYAKPNVIQSLSEGIGRGLVQIEVTGSVYDPQIKTKTLPLIEETLNLFGSREASQN